MRTIEIGGSELAGVHPLLQVGAGRLSLLSLTVTPFSKSFALMSKNFLDSFFGMEELIVIFVLYFSRYQNVVS
jgi:hypothetical protein